MRLMSRLDEDFKDNMERILAEQADYMFEMEREFINLVLTEDSTGNFLDIGCGNGLYLSLIRKAYPSLTLKGIDSNPELLASALKLAKTKPLNNTTIQGEDIFTYQPSQKFDYIFHRLTAQYFPDKAQKLLDKVDSLLNPGGCYFFIEPDDEYAVIDQNFPGASKLLQAVGQIIGYKGRHFSRIMLPLLEKKGFTKIRYKVGMVNQYSHPDKDKFYELLYIWARGLHMLDSSIYSDEDLRNFKKEIIEAQAAPGMIASIPICFVAAYKPGENDESTNF